MKHRILVAGGAGYIGSHVQKQLLEDGFEVAVFDDLSSGDRKNILPGAAFIEGNILDKAALNAAPRMLNSRERSFPKRMWQLNCIWIAPFLSDTLPDCCRTAFFVLPLL